MGTHGTVTEVKDFHVLPVELPQSKAPHYVFFKKHTIKSSADQGRALFFFNLPINTTTATMKRYLLAVSIGATLEKFTPSILTDYPEDAWVDLTKLTSDLEILHIKHINREVYGDGEGTRIPKHCGVVTLIDKPSMQLAFSSLKKLSAAATVTKWPLDEPFGGLAYFLNRLHKQILDPEWLSLVVSQAVIEFDKAEQKSINDLQEQTQLVDEDGFTLVVGSHRKTKASILGKQKLAATVGAERADTKLKKKEKEDFYRFQLRQKKKDEMNDLLKKFKVDQERVRHMTEKKRFRPY